MKNKYLIVIVLLVNIFAITIPYIYKNHNLKNEIEKGQNKINKIYTTNKNALNEKDYYKLVRELNESSISNGFTNISTDTSFSEFMTYSIAFSSDKESLKNYIHFLDKMQKDLILSEAVLNFKNGEKSHITLIGR